MFRKLTDSTLSWLAALALTGVALLLRLPGFDGRPLFIDELWRALLILDPQFLASYLAPTVESAITSPIYALLVKSAAAISISPDMLRMPSLLSGLLACLLAFALTREAGGGIALSLLAGLFFALNGNFITYSNQMKPYMFEVCVHLACLYAWLATIAAPRLTPAIWAGCFSLLVLAVFSTPSAVFLLPSFGISLFVPLVVRRDFQNLLVCCAGFAGMGVVVLGLYYFSWRHGASTDMLSIWSDGFSGPGNNYLPFLGTHLLAMWQASFQIIVAEPLLAALGLALFTAAIGWAFITETIRRRPLPDILLFYALLLVTLCFLNVLHIWPLGALRPNLFLYADMLIFLFLVLAQISVPRMAVRIGAAAAALGFVLSASAYSSKLNFPALVNRLHNDGAPIEPSDLVVQDFSYGGAVGKTIAANCASRKSVIAVEGVMAMAIRYYTVFDAAHHQSAALLNTPCVQLVTLPEPYADPAAAAATLSRLQSGTPGIWLLYTHYDDSNVAALRQVAARFGQIQNAKAYGLPGSTGGAGYFELIGAPQH